MVSIDDTGTSREDAATLSSVMPILDDLLDLIGKKATAEEVGGDSNDEIITVAKQLHSRMEEMKRLALDLPGGHITLDKARELEDILDLEAEKRRAVLRAFSDTKMDTVDRLNAGAESGMITPAVMDREG